MYYYIILFWGLTIFSCGSINKTVLERDKDSVITVIQKSDTIRLHVDSMYTINKSNVYYNRGLENVFMDSAKYFQFGSILYKINPSVKYEIKNRQIYVFHEDNTFRLAGNTIVLEDNLNSRRMADTIFKNVNLKIDYRPEYVGQEYQRLYLIDSIGEESLKFLLGTYVLANISKNEVLQRLEFLSINKSDITIKTDLYYTKNVDLNTFGRLYTGFVIKINEVQN